MKDKLKALLIAVTVSFLLSLQYIERYTDGKNRMLFYWNNWDGLAIIFSSFLIGLLFFSVYELANKFRNRYIVKIVKSFFILIFSIAVIKDIEWWLFQSTNHSQQLGILLRFLIYFLYVLVFFAVYLHLFTRKISQKIIGSFVKLCLVFSPIILVFLITSFSYKAWTASKGTLPYSRKKAWVEDKDRPNVFIFIFDEWSYDRSYNDKQLLPIFKSLRRFQKESITFHQAYSPYHGTFRSLPNFIFQNTYDYGVQNKHLFFEEPGGKKIAINELKNIFTTPHRNGYFTAIIGFYHPYVDFLGNDADFVKSFSSYKRLGENFLAVTAYHLFRNFVLYSFHFFPQITEWAQEVCHNQYQLRRISIIHQQTFSIIENVDKPTFALFHYPIPHKPFVYNQDGPKDIFQIYEGTVDQYVDNMAYLDKIIGEIIFTLRQSGKYESSLIIITSDHSWRNDPNAIEDISHPERRHIPLFVKFPNQKMGYENNIKLNTSDLFEFLKRTD